MKRAMLFLAILASGCDNKPDDKSNPGTKEPGPEKDKPPVSDKKKPEGEPDRITVQHILIAFKGAEGADAKVTRTREEALGLANELVRRARQGEDFDVLMKAFSTDSGGGTYPMANWGVMPQAGETARDGMVANFGNVGFKLKVGEIGLTDFHPTDGKFGYHVIKRLK